MIQYSFPIAQISNFEKIVTMIESNYQITLHTSSPLPTILTNINGSLGLSTSPSGSILYVSFFESKQEYSLKDSNGNIVYSSAPLTVIPTESQIRSLIEGLL